MIQYLTRILNTDRREKASSHPMKRFPNSTWKALGKKNPVPALARRRPGKGNKTKRVLVYFRLHLRKVERPESLLRLTLPPDNPTLQVIVHRPSLSRQGLLCVGKVL